MCNISFTSKFVPMTLSDFANRTSSFNRDNLVDYPWTPASSKVAKDVFTYRVCDCSAALVTDGEKALLMHFVPSNEKNHDFKQIIKLIANNFDMNNSGRMQAVLVGAKPYSESIDVFNIFRYVFDKLKMPTTILYNGKGATNIAYRTCTDEVYISNFHIDKSLKKGKSAIEAINSGFEKAELSEADEV